MIKIEWAFTKGFVRWRGRNRISPVNAWFMRNMRIRNNVIVQKRWANYINTSTWSAEIQALLRYKLDGHLLAVANGTLYKNVQSSWTSVGSVWWYTTPYTMISYGDFVMILNWVTHMYIYHKLYGVFKQDSGAGFQSWSAVLPPEMDDGVSSVVEAYPLIWCTITWFTLIAWNNSVTKKTLYISKPVTPVEPWNCYNFSTTAGQDYDIGENRYMDSGILAMVSAGENAYVFCQESIEIIGRATANVTWSIVTLATQKIWSTNQIINKDCADVVGDKVFYIDKELKICTINYEPGIENPLIWIISWPIQDWLDLNVRNDSLHAKVFHDRKEGHVEFHLVKIDWTSTTMPDIVVIRDLASQSFYIDDDQAFKCIVRWGSEMTLTYASTWQYLFRDNDSDTYDNRREDTSGTATAITAQYNTINMALGTPQEKMFQWFIVRWWIDESCNIQFDCYIDWTLEFTQTIIDNDIPTAEKNVVSTWDPKSYSNSQKIRPFEFVADVGMVRRKGKRIRIQITCTGTSANKFYLDELWIDAVATGNYELSDKF